MADLKDALSDAQHLFDITPNLRNVVMALTEADPTMFVGIARGPHGPVAIGFANTEAAALDAMATAVGLQPVTVPDTSGWPQLEQDTDPCDMAGCGHAFADHKGGEDCAKCDCTWWTGPDDQPVILSRSVQRRQAEQRGDEPPVFA